MSKLPTVVVWSKADQCFIRHIECPGEKRVRIDVDDDVSNYTVYRFHRGGNTELLCDMEPLDWEINLS